VRPGATTIIDGRYLPNPPQVFKGGISPNAFDSKPYWPEIIVPPEGAPNVLLIMIDDEGFSAPSTFGGVIPTPAMDRIDAEGLRYIRFHTTALCSPTRAALLTGRNHHSAATGVVVDQAIGFPGYNSVIPRSTAAIGDILRQNGYHTSWFGTDHNVPQWEASEAQTLPQLADRAGEGLRLLLWLGRRRHQPMAAGQPVPQHHGELCSILVYEREVRELGRRRTVAENCGCRVTTHPPLA
jgi:hypothetical protein